MDKVNFICMEDGTPEEYAFLDKLENQYVQDLPARLIVALKAIDSSLSGYQISRLEHSLQGATRAFLAEEDLEMVMAVLFHDIGDSLAPYSHSEMAAAILLIVSFPNELRNHELDLYCDHTLVHTGQNYDFELNEVFFEQLKMQKPYVNLGIGSGRHGEKTAKILGKSQDNTIIE